MCGGRGERRVNAKRGSRWERFLNVKKREAKRKKVRTKGREDEGLGCKLTGGQAGERKTGFGEERASRSTVLEG